ncbi:hypothetical protein SAMN05192543_101513 [Paraburkholderia megapolitana]|uniref:Uncharacterized protein n=1 Tax=Paraburkholderia megapolitana TaxID=420953 RepID=A0A1I3DT91_9BURK|nr:hypothetical protein SAMN05192543_101513 [Paraburkholderia megapolitana]
MSSTVRPPRRTASDDAIELRDMRPQVTQTEGAIANNESTRTPPVEAKQNTLIDGLKSAGEFMRPAPGKLKAIRANFRGRPMTVGSRILGTGKTRSSDTPNPAFITEPSTESTIGPVPDSGLLTQADEIADRVEATLDTSLAVLPEINKRPQRSLGMRALAAIPGLGHAVKPKTIRQLMASDPAYKATSGTATQTTGDRSSSATETRARQVRMLEQLDTHRQIYEQAARNVQQAEGELESAKREASAPASSSTAAELVKAKEQSLKEAHNQLTKAAADLRASASVSSLLDVGAQVLSTDLVHQKIKFVDTQITHVRNALGHEDEHAAGIVDHLTTLKTQIDRKYQSSTKNLADAQKLNDETVALVEELEQLENQLAEVQTTLQIPPGANAKAAQERIARDALKNSAGRILKTRQEEAHDAQRARTEFIPYLDEEIGRLGQLQGKLKAASDKLKGPGASVSNKQKTTQTQLDWNRELEQQLSILGTHTIASTAPGFDAASLAGTDGRDLVARLQKVAEALPPDDTTAERMLPRAAAVEMISRALAVATGGNLKDAGQLLDDLTAHPLNHWIRPPENDGSEIGYTAPSAQMENLLEFMAHIPRGTEVLNLASTAPLSDGLERAQVEAVQAYWIAHETQKSATDDVKTWLGKAMNVASRAVRNSKEQTVFDVDGLPLRERAAFNAVRNGFLSNAKGSDYDLNNQNLLKVTDSIEHLEDTRPAYSSWLPRTAHPAKLASPFHPRAVKFAQRQMEAQGMETTKTRAEASIMTTFEQLGKDARKHFGELSAQSTQPAQRAGTAATPAQSSAGAAGGEQERLLSATLIALSDYVGHEQRSPSLVSRLASPMSPPDFRHTKRIYDAQLGPNEKTRIRQAVYALLVPPRPASGPRRLTKPNPNHVVALPPAIEALFENERVSIVDLLKTLEQTLGSSPDATKAAMASSITALREDFATDSDSGAKIEDKVRLAKMRGVHSKGDVKEFFRPMLETLRLRDQITLTSGGTLGGGIPILPAVPKFPMTASIGVHAKRAESYIQIKSPTFASEIQVGTIDSTVRDAKVTLGHRLEVGIATLTAPSGTVKFEMARPVTTSTTFRILRGKDEKGARKEQEAIDDTLNLLDVMLAWDEKVADDGAPFADPLEAIFAMCPDALVASGERKAQTNQFTMEAGAIARLRTPGHHFSVGATVTPLSLKAERTTERGTEQTGYPHQAVYDQSSQTRQRANASASAGVMGTPFQQPIGKIGADGKGTGEAHINLTGNLVEVSRELASNFEKNGATRFPIGDLTGGSVDRSYGTPKDLLAEIETNREDWLLRCLDVLPREKTEEVDTFERRTVAAGVLAQFESDLRAAGSNSSFQFNIKYEMNPRISGLIDGLRGVEALAVLQGDMATAAETRKAMNSILSYRACWTAKNMAVRSKGKTSEDMGIDFFLRWQKTASSESSRAISVFPA